MIQVRYRIVDSKITRTKEYLMVYPGTNVKLWKSLIDLAAESPHDLQPYTISDRIKNESNNTVFRTLYGCVHTPKLNTTSRTELKNKMLGTEEDLPLSEDWIKFNQTMPVGSMLDKSRIIQSRRPGSK